MKKILIFIVVMLAAAGLTITGCKKGEEVKPVPKTEHKTEHKKGKSAAKKKASSKKSTDTKSTKKKSSQKKDGSAPMM